MGLSQSQKLAYAVFAPIPVAILSIVGSSLTLTTLYRTHKAGSKLLTYHRLMLGISISDLIFSSCWVFGPLPVPADEYHLVGSVGNTFTCRLQGFFMTVGYATFTYNMMLMIYFLLVIRFSVREKIIASRVEPFMHLFPILYHLSIGITCLVKGLYHPAASYCWIKPTPVYCQVQPDIPCEAELAVFIDAYFVTAVLFVEAVIVISVLIVVGFTVWARYRHTQRRSFEHNIGDNNLTKFHSGDNFHALAADTDSVQSRGTTTATAQQRRRRRPSRMERRSRRVVVQCFLYGIFFFNTILWSNIYVVVTFTNKTYIRFYRRNPWTAVLALFFLPGQGIFNFLIYIRPRYKSIRASCKELPRQVALKEAIWYPVSNRRERIRRHLRQTSTPAGGGDRGSGGGGSHQSGDYDGNDFLWDEKKSSTSERRGVLIIEPVDLEASAGSSGQHPPGAVVSSSAGSSSGAATSSV